MTWRYQLRFIVLLLALLQVATPAVGGFLVRNWSDEEGLPQSVVNSIVQTQDGYLWVGTDMGLVRFDGTRFVSFSLISGRQLDSVGVSKLFKAQEGDLWIGLGNGRLFNWKNGVVVSHQVANTGFNQAVVAMAQEADHTLWVQTAEGRLGRLTANGIAFVAKTGPVPNSANLGLVVDAQNTLWVGTGDGLKVWQNGNLITPAGLESLRGQPIEAMAPGQDGSVWIFQNRRLQKLQAGRLVAQIEAPAKFNSPAVALLETTSHGLWLAASDGNLFFLAADGVWQIIPAENGLRGSNRTLCEDLEGNLWRGSIGGGLTQFRPQVFSSFGMPASIGYSLIVSFDGSDKWGKGASFLAIDNVLLQTLPSLATNYWQDFNGLGATPDSVGWNGGFAYSGADSEIHAITPSGVGGSGGLLTSLNVTDGPNLGAFTEYWTESSTLPEGANLNNLSLTAQITGSRTGAPFSLRLNDHSGHYIDFKSTIASAGVFQSVGGPLNTANFIDPGFNFSKRNLDNYALSVCSDAAGNVWMQPNSHTLARIAAGSQTPQAWSGPTVPQTVRTLFFDRRNTLWAGTDGGYLYRLHAGAFEPVLRVDDTADFISAIFEDAQSNLWVGFSSGAGIGVLPQGDPARWHVINGLTIPDVRSIAQASDGALWFGTSSGGASRLQNGHLTNFSTRDGLSSDSVRCIHTDSDGTVWLGTLHGLCRWRHERFSTIDTEDGLWNSCISHIEEDRHGNFWISSFGGIFRIARQELNRFADGQQTSIQCIGYNRNDGLPSQECPGGFQPAGTQTPDGRLWFPTGGGLVCIDPDQVSQNRLAPQVYLEEVTVEGAVHAFPPSPAALQAGPGKHRFEFRFTATSLTAPEKVRFRHKLEGLDRDWSKPDEHRTAAYSFVPPGHYTFRVSACNPDGVWNPTGASLALVIQPFFWQTAGFKVAIALALALALAWSGYHVERRKARVRFERVKQQNELERERSRIARDIHDDLGASLTQIIFFSERVGSEHDTPLEVENWNRRIAIAARSSIQSLDEIVWAVSPKYDTLESLANYLTQFVREYLALAGIRCLLEVPPLLPSMDINAEVRHNLLLAAREAVQNVIAHAAASEVRLTLQLHEDALEITIADNGHGFAAEQLDAHGNGLNNMRQRIEMIGGWLEVVGQAGHGTVVRFSVPRSRLHFRGIDAPAG